MKQIYYDNSATTKIDDRVLQEMMPYLQDEYGNSGSLHSFGQNALEAVETGREKIADFLNCEVNEVYFTSGATESNNIAIQGILKKWGKGSNPKIITSKIEHPAVLEVFKIFEKNNLAEVKYIKVDEFGVVDFEELKKEINSNTLLVSIMYANNEVGSIQPIKEIGEFIQLEKDKRKPENPIYFHTDAVQAINYLNCDVRDLNVDLLSFSGHKIYASKGIGVLFIKAGVKLEPIYFGGHQENNLRVGTLNVPAIVSLGKAVELISQDKNQYIQKIQKIKDKLIKELDKFENIKFNGDEDKQLPNILNVSFLKAEGESILLMLDADGIAISTGSACSSGSLEPSHVLTAMGNKPEWSHGSIRISLGKYNSESEINPFIKSLEKIILKLRKMAP